MSNVNKALAVLAALAFFLPCVSLSTNVPYIKVNMGISVSGEKLVQCYLSPCTARDIMGSQPGILGAIAGAIPSSAMTETIKLSGSDVPDLGINFLLFASIAVVIAAIALFVGRGGELLSGLASVGVIVLLFMFRSKIGDAITPFLNSPEMKSAGGMAQVQFQYGIGFWACAVLSALSGILAFKGTGGAQRSVVAVGSAGGFVPQPQPGGTPSTGEKLAVCPACGSVNSAGSKFCLSCGAAMAAAPTPPAPEKPAAAPPGTVCPSCGSSSAGSGKFCLACGGSLAASSVPAVEKKAEVAPSGPSCPSCGSTNAGSGKFCLACGATLAGPSAQAPAASPIPEKVAVPEPQGPVCPSCGSSAAGAGKFCLACGAALTAPAAQSPAEPPVSEKVAAPEPQGPVCPSCGSTNPGSGKFCLACGGSLMSGVQLFQPSETSVPAASATPPATAAAAASVASAAPVAMAAQASAAAPAGQSLRAVAPARATEPAAEQPIAASAAVPFVEEAKKASAQSVPVSVQLQPVEEQQSIDWAPAPTTSQLQQVCASCGATLIAEQKFCLSCGTPVGQSSLPARTEAPAFTSAPASEQIQHPPATQLFEPARKSSSKAWIAIVLGVAALGAGGYFGWQYFTRPDVTVTTNVQRIHVAAGGKTSLEANVSGSSNTDVDWSVQEGAKGGQVTASGTVMSGGQLRSGALYTAPQASGTYHVIATSRANSSRSAKIEIIVGGTAPDTSTTSPQPAPPSAPTATTSSSPSAAPSAAATYPNAAQIVGTWTGPTADTRTIIGADSTISMSSATNAQNNKSGTYKFTDNTHLDIDLGNGDVRKWEILGFQGAYMRVSEQATSGSSALIFQKVQ